jgi:hypothetical protein
LLIDKNNHYNIIDLKNTNIYYQNIMLKSKDHMTKLLFDIQNISIDLEILSNPTKLKEFLVQWNLYNEIVKNNTKKGKVNNPSKQPLNEKKGKEQSTNNINNINVINNNIPINNSCTDQDQVLFEENLLEDEFDYCFDVDSVIDNEIDLNDEYEQVSGDEGEEEITPKTNVNNIEI